ncbi:N-6 DNA methylase [Photobacterium swingsii]|uniref:N-6 DNA methylase n=1 Tax=Photobacterium swingsii TaxID=680026 RepID=UPI004067B799
MVELNQYYTSEATSFLLASMLDVSNVQSCLELSAGEGALIEPIKKRNQSVHFTTVDLDKKNTNKLKKRYPEDIHICNDALDLNLNLESESFDLAVCNPPFSYTTLTNEHRKILGEKFNPAFKKAKKIRTEVLFIIRNLFFLKKGTTLAIIIPDFIFTSCSLSNFRRVLFEHYTLSRVVECEYKSFKKTEAKTFILFIEKNKPKNRNTPIPYSFLSEGKIKNKEISLKSTISTIDLAERDEFLIFRGSRSSKECRLTGRQFHHNYAHLLDLSDIFYDEVSEKLQSFKYASAGDIMIHRVGRNVGKTVFLKKGTVIVSDCIIVIRFIDLKLRHKFIKQWSFNKEKWILNNYKGTCAKNISISNIKSFISLLK